MKRYSVDIGRPDGKAGETLTIQARSEEDARAQALDNEEMLKHADWEVISVVEL